MVSWLPKGRERDKGRYRLSGPGERIAFGSTRDSIRPQKQALFTKLEKMSYYTYCEFKCITNVPAEMDGTGKLFT